MLCNPINDPQKLPDMRSLRRCSLLTFPDIPQTYGVCILHHVAQGEGRLPPGSQTLTADMASSSLTPSEAARRREQLKATLGCRQQEQEELTQGTKKKYDNWCSFYPSSLLALFHSLWVLGIGAALFRLIRNRDNL